MQSSSISSSVEIANYFIGRALADEDALTSMQVLKLVYIAHGWFLGVIGKPLISDEIQAWKYGPVIPSLYQELKGFAKDGHKCSSYISLWDGESGNWSHPQVKSKNIISFLNIVWRNYGSMSGSRLSALTHEEGTPWDIVWRKEKGSRARGSTISNKLIKEYYDSKLVK